MALPGECIQAPKGTRGGLIRTELWSSGAPIARPRVSVRKGKRTEVHVDADRLRVTQRTRCDGSIWHDAR